jgi:stage II sporulation protein D
LNKKLKLKNGYCIVIVLSIFCFFNTIILGAAKQTITIGLESLYKDAASIRIASQNNLLLGYSDGNSFKEEGLLNSNSVTLKKAAEDYYFTGSIYNTFRDAEEAAKTYGNGAVAAYLDAGTYCVYINNYKEGLLAVPPSSLRIGLFNDSNELIFISDSSRPLLLQGSENGYSFPLTQVGSTRKYRGAVGAVSGQSGGLTAINVVNLEDYLYGVVPVEMAPGWPQEALKAQAVAARSIAEFQYNRYLSKGYNVVDTTATQVYKGFSCESPSTNLAVDETRGEVIKYNNQVAEALYFSTSGGITEDAKYIWGNEVPYFRAVVDRFESEPAQKPWIRTITISEINTSLVNQGINIGNLQGAEITSRTPSGRVQTLTLLGTSGSHILKNETVRSFFSSTKEGSLKSRLFSFSNFIGTPAQSASGMTVSIMSADNFVQKDISRSSIISSNGIGVIQTGISTVQSAETVKTLNSTSGNSSNSSSFSIPLQNEIVFGDLIIYGQGFGHGLGMSQSGAKGMAKAGYNYKEILTYYYNGVTVER